jgi:predicted N-acetyltransferase YhbS
MNFILRAGKPEDASACGRICYEAFKAISEHHNFPPDFPNVDVGIGLIADLLSRKDVYSVVAEDDGKIVGSNFLWENAIISGVGPITIDPHSQNKSVGKALMQDVLQRAQERGFAGVRLVQAAYHNRSLSLYTKLGFDTREPLSIIQGEPLNIKIEGFNVRNANQNDVEACNNLSMRVHGFHRGPELLEAIKQESATVVERAGRITGYSTMLGFLGHTTAENNEDLKSLIGAAPNFAGPGFLLPTRNSDVFRWCLEKGLRVVQPMTLMSKGLYNKPAGAFIPSVIY